jgi:hypothetical protein
MWIKIKNQLINLDNVKNIYTSSNLLYIRYSTYPDDFDYFNFENPKAAKEALLEISCVIDGMAQIDIT